jgi:hypothetical protein
MSQCERHSLPLLTTARPQLRSARLPPVLSVWVIPCRQSRRLTRFQPGSKTGTNSIDKKSHTCLLYA